MYGQTNKVACILLLSAFFGAILFPPAASAVTQSSSGVINVDGVVNGPPPATPPTIESPAPDTTFTQKSITVKGSCVVNLVVKIYRNGFFAGSALCQSNGKYSLNIDLYVGKNDLVARQFDTANQASPDSNKVVVFYTPATPPPLPDEPGATPTDSRSTQTPGEAPTGTAQFQLIIEYDYTLQAIFVDKSFHLPITFAGGTAPYAININWGDDSNDVFSRESTAQFTTDHIYTKTGYRTATITVSDKNNNKASLQFVLLINGIKDFSSKTDIATIKQEEAWWQITQVGIFITSIVGSFLLGRHSRRIVRS